MALIGAATERQRGDRTHFVTLLRGQCDGYAFALYCYRDGNAYAQQSRDLALLALTA